MKRGYSVNPLWREAVEHVVSLGFSRVDAEALANMDGIDCGDEHLEYILECDRRDILAWCPDMEPEVKA